MSEPLYPGIGPEETPTRWQIFRRMAVFQYKLLIDAAKDFLLSPLSIIAALIDMANPRPQSQMMFTRLMRQGRRAERAINLFGKPVRESEWTVDRLVDSLEDTLRDQYLRPRESGEEPGSPGARREDGREDR